MGIKEGAARKPQLSQAAILHKGWPPRRATLYLYLEADPSARPESLKAAIQDTSRWWQGSNLSTTAALQGAAAEALRALGKYARPSWSGIACASVREGQVYLVQGGTATAYLLGPRGWRKLAAPTPWDLTHTILRQESLGPGGLLVLAPAGFEDTGALYQGGVPAREVPLLLRSWLAGSTEASALLVVLEEGREVATVVSGSQPDTASESGAGSRPSLQVPPPRPRAKGLEKDKKHRGPAAGAPPEPSNFPILRALRLPLLIVAALLAVFILGGLAWYLPSHQKRQDEGRLVTLLQEAQRAKDEALLYSDKVLARQHLARAEGLVKEAQALREKDRRVTSLQEQIRRDLDKVNSVLRLSEVKTLVDLSKLGGNQSNPSRVVVDGNNLYVLDNGARRVYKFLMNESGQSLLVSPNDVLVRKGDLHGGTAVEDLTEMVWMPPGSLRPASGLLVLDSRGSLLEYRPEKGIQLLPLRGSVAWMSFKGARGYNGNLYVLDPAANQIWRYIPTATGYDSEARPVLEGLEIKEGVDLAIDGNVYVLTGGGKVMRFGGGPPLAFSQDKMDRPLASPAAIFASPSTKYLYVADRGNQRIVVFSKEGGFERQLWAEALEGVQGLFVDEGRGRLYFVAGKKVYMAVLPMPGP